MAKYFWMIGVVLALAGPLEATQSEGCSGPNDLRPNSCPTTADMAALPEHMLQDHIFFVRGGKKLDPFAKHRLDMLASALRAPLFENTCLRFIGHSDIGGDADANLALSLVRAEVVHEYLEAQLGPSMPKSWVEGHGETDPLPSLDASDALNRRVTLWARDCPNKPNAQ